MDSKKIAALAAVLDIFNVEALATGIADGKEQGFELSMGMTYEDGNDQWAYDCGTWLGASIAVRPPASRRPFTLTNEGFMVEGRLVFTLDQAMHLMDGQNSTIAGLVNDRFSQMLLQNEAICGLLSLKQHSDLIHSFVNIVVRNKPSPTASATSNEGDKRIHEQALALGYSSVEQMHATMWNFSDRRTKFDSEKVYQTTSYAHQRREAAGVTADTWVCLPEGEGHHADA